MLTPYHVVPNPVLGGVTTFLFASVAVSGIRVLSYTSFTRRDRFVLASAFSFGFADLLVPGIFTHLFESSKVARAVAAHAGLQGLLDSVGIVLQTPCRFLLFTMPHILRLTSVSLQVLIAGIVAVVLNLTLPQEDAAAEDDEPVADVEIVDIEGRELSESKKQ